MDLLIDLAMDLPMRPPPVTEALRGWMFMVDCKHSTTASQHYHSVIMRLQQAHNIA